METIAPGVSWIPVYWIVNAYTVGEPGQPWCLVDAGIPGTAQYLKNAVEERYGPGARPEAILLTHGHYDHVGAARELSDAWDVPMFIHPLERPFVTGADTYPPPDPVVGGFYGHLSRLAPVRHGFDLGPRLQTLPEDGSVPFMPGWRWVFTPGHSPGHVSFFREEDAVLLAGDAFITVDMNSASDVFTQKPEISVPPPPFTVDWDAAEQSVRALAELNPQVVATGHGQPMAGPDIPEQLQFFRDAFHAPEDGRYVREPVRSNEEGVTYLPSPAPDPVGVKLKWGLLLALAAWAVSLRRR